MAPPPTIEAVDWFTLIWALIRSGHTLVAISERTGISHSTLRGYVDGSLPPHWRGELLVALWCEVFDKPRDDLPLIELSLSHRAEIVRDMVRSDEATVAALSQMQFAWTHDVPATAPVTPPRVVAASPAPAPKEPETSIRFRVGVARIGIELRAFIAYTREDEQGARKAANFLGWAGEWQDVALESL